MRGHLRLCNVANRCRTGLHCEVRLNSHDRYPLIGAVFAGARLNFRRWRQLLPVDSGPICSVFAIAPSYAPFSAPFL